MTEILRPDLCVLGGGGAGLAAARAAAGLGAKVIVVEKRALGGNYLAEAIPVQAFCAAAASVAAIKRSRQFGIEAERVKLDLASLSAHLQNVVKQAGLEN